MLDGRHLVKLEYFYLWFWCSFDKILRWADAYEMHYIVAQSPWRCEKHYSVFPHWHTHTHTVKYKYAVNTQHHIHNSRLFCLPFLPNHIHGSMRTIITACPFQMQTTFSPFKAYTIWWDKSEKHQQGKKKILPPICTHFRLNMNWPKSPLVDEFLVSAVLGYLIWTLALGSLEFIQ